MNRLRSKFDIFAAPVPQFNLDGRERIHSLLGLLCSLVLFLIIFTFSLVKLLHSKSPLITSYQQITNQPVNVDFQMAFFVQDSLTKKIKSNSNLVEWKGVVLENGKAVQEMGVHRCTDDDYE